MRQLACAIILLALALSLPLANANDETNANQTTIAKAFVEEMSKGQFDEATQRAAPILKPSLANGGLKRIWNSVIGQFGEFQSIKKTRSEFVQQYHLVFVTTEFERGGLDIKVVFSPNSQISGLFLVPTGKYESPSYVDTTTFKEKEITFGTDPWVMPGTLSMPKGKGPIPALVLVHGSGPQDRDETVGPNKPLRDIAQGLASQGIAVFRYEKRTKQHQLALSLQPKAITVKEETIDDALAAAERLTKFKNINKQKIFILGHSLGGSLIPRIDNAPNTIAGYISLAGSTRALEDVILEQVKYLAQLDGKMTDEEQQSIDQFTKQVTQVKSPELSAETPTEDLPLGVPAAYWLDLRGYVPAASAVAVQKPMLFLQGERDYQVTMDDFAIWKEHLQSKPNVTFISYPKLNHLFISGEGKSKPNEYLEPGNVDQAVIDDIAGWIIKQSTRSNN